MAEESKCENVDMDSVMNEVMVLLTLHPLMKTVKQIGIEISFSFQCGCIESYKMHTNDKYADMSERGQIIEALKFSKGKAD